MSSNSIVPKATASTLLNSLQQVGGYVGLAVQLGEVLVPIGKALIQKIHGVNAAGQPTITYQLLVAGDEAALVDVDNMSTTDLAAINAELVRLGRPPLTVPTPNPPPITPGS